jgi:hypothetical protein
VAIAFGSGARTFESADLAARAYDVMVWRFDSAAGRLNFFDVNGLATTEFVALVFNVITHTEECTIRWEYMRMSIRNHDEAEMAAFHAAHLEHVEAELEFCVQLAAQRAAAAAARPSSSSAMPLVTPQNFKTKKNSISLFPKFGANKFFELHYPMCIMHACMW